MMNKLNTNMDKTTQKMTRVDEKLKEMIRKQSTWCLYAVIIAEIVAIVLLIII